jgi:CheY-like chemotaxis protein
MARPRILVADDNPHVRKALRVRLAAMGCDVVEAADGLGVLREFPRARFAAILLDHEMPSGDGRSIAQVVRKENDVPIVFLSGHNREDFRSIVMRLPNVYFLPKPLDERRLAALLSSLIGAPLPQSAAV